MVMRIEGIVPKYDDPESNNEISHSVFIIYNIDKLEDFNIEGPPNFIINISDCLCSRNAFRELYTSVKDCSHV